MIAEICAELGLRDEYEEISGMRFTEEEWADWRIRRARESEFAQNPPRFVDGPGRTETFRLESEFQAWVVGLAHKHGWRHYHTHRSDRSPKGWPDLVLAHSTAPVVLFRELKTDGRVPTEDQRWWLERLVGAGFDSKVWRPADREEIIRTLANPDLSAG